MTARIRSLPVLAPGPAETSFVIKSYDEDVTHDTVWGEHSHPFHELIWNERGASTAVVGSRVWTVTPTVGIWMPAGVLHSGSAAVGTRLRTSFFSFDTTASLSASPVAVEITPLLRLLLDRLDDSGLSAHSRSATETLVIDVLEPSPRELFVHVPVSPLLRPIAEAVREDPGDARTLTEWATELGVSSRTVTRAFHAETGTSFARWIAAVRAQHAVRLLSQGWDVEAVAEEVGYRSASAFGVAFRRTTGLTPGAFRAR